MTHGSELTGAAEVIDALDRAVDDSLLDVRRAALVALAELGTEGRSHIDARQADPDLGGLARRLLELHAP